VSTPSIKKAPVTSIAKRLSKVLCQVSWRYVIK